MGAPFSFLIAPRNKVMEPELGVQIRIIFRREIQEF
jgi:hypothetical protein